jgi:hypothetical protein
MGNYAASCYFYLLSVRLASKIRTALFCFGCLARELAIYGSLRGLGFIRHRIGLCACCKNSIHLAMGDPGSDGEVWPFMVAGMTWPLILLVNIDGQSCYHSPFLNGFNLSSNLNIT